MNIRADTTITNSMMVLTEGKTTKIDLTDLPVRVEITTVMTNQVVVPLPEEGITPNLPDTMITEIITNVSLGKHCQIKKKQKDLLLGNASIATSKDICLEIAHKGVVLNTQEVGHPECQLTILNPLLKIMRRQTVLVIS